MAVRLAVPQKVRSARLEVRRDDVAFAELQVLEFPMRDERYEREAAVHHDARVWSRGHEPVHSSLQAIERRRGRRLRRAGKECDVLGPETESHPFTGLRVLTHVEALRPGFEH